MERATSSRGWPPASGRGGTRFSPLAIAGPLLCLLGAGGRGGITAYPDATSGCSGCVALASLLAYLITPETAAGPDGQPLGFAFNLRYAAPVLALSLALLPLAPVLAGRAAALALAAVLARRARGNARAGAPVALAPGRRCASGFAVACWWRPRWPGCSRGAPVRRPPSPAAAIGPAPPLRRQPARDRRDRRRVPLAAPLPARPLRVPPGRLLPGAGVGVLPRRPSTPASASSARSAASSPIRCSASTTQTTSSTSARRGPHGSFTPIGSCAEWRAAVNAGHFRYLVTTPARDPWHPKPLHPSPEGRWTASDPAARLIYTRRATGQPISIYELSGPLHPRSCA